MAALDRGNGGDGKSECGWLLPTRVSIEQLENKRSASDDPRTSRKEVSVTEEEVN